MRVCGGDSTNVERQHAQTYKNKKIDTHTQSREGRGKDFLGIEREKLFFATFTPSMNEPVARAEAITIVVRKKEKRFSLFFFFFFPLPSHSIFNSTVQPTNNNRPTSISRMEGDRQLAS